MNKDVIEKFILLQYLLYVPYLLIVESSLLTRDVLMEFSNSYRFKTHSRKNLVLVFKWLGWMEFYAVSAIFQPNGNLMTK